MALMVGDDGKVFCGSTPLADITSWRFETSAAGVSYASSSTDGYRRRIVGARQGKGKFCFRVDAAAPVWGVLSDGSQVTLQLNLDDTRYYSVPAVVEAVNVDVDVSGGKPIVGEATFVTDGAWSVPS